MGEATVAEALVDPAREWKNPAHDAIGLVHVRKDRAQGTEGEARRLWAHSGNERRGHEEERGSKDVGAQPHFRLQRYENQRRRKPRA